MYKVLLVDDYRPDLDALLETIQILKELDIQVIGTCSSAGQALEFLAQNQPDIIISDIKMPQMDGFGLARAVRRDFPQVKFIFTSLYSEFEYARKALYLDSYGYLLKPVDAQEVRECLTRVTTRLSEETQHAREYEAIKARLYQNIPFLMEAFLRDLIYGLERRETAVGEQAEFLGLPVTDSAFALLLAEIDDYPQITHKLNSEQKQVISLRVHEKLRDLVGSDGVPIRLDSSHFGLLLWDGQKQPESHHEMVLEQLAERIIQEFSQSDLSLSLAASSFSEDLHTLNQQYEQCVYRLRLKYSLGKGRLIRVADIPTETAAPDINFNAMQKELRFLLNSGSREELTTYLDSLFRQSPGEAGETYYKNLGFGLLIGTQLVLNDQNVGFQTLLDETERLVWEQLLKFETVTDAQNWIRELLLRAHQHLGEKSADKNRRLAEEVKQYIERGWNQNLSLEMVSADFHFSANYLNLIFKQETGETIFEYTNRVKMEKAKILLSDPKLKLYQVAEMLGYTSAVYFGNVFRKYAGMTPKEYRERNGSWSNS